MMTNGNDAGRQIEKTTMTINEALQNPGKGITVTDKLIIDLESEVSRLKASYKLEVDRGATMLQDFLTSTHMTTRAVNYSSHLGHNLGSVSNELSKLAGQIESTEAMLRHVKTLVEFSGK